MAQIHITGIDYVELNQEQVEFSYKPDVPKLKLVGTIYEASEESEDDDIQSVVFLTQNQLNKVLSDKEVELKSVDDGKWQIQKPLSREQIRKIGLVSLESEYLGDLGEYKCFEVTNVTF
ncbi:MAG: hypothetical protein JST67_07730 [Bacteroidetes bacterium]|nr:hypothetical protein [Bacteroidota bacterium]